MRHFPPAALALLCAIAVPAAAHAGTFDHDYSDYARNIIPSGQQGDVPIPKGADKQAKMYDALTPLFDKVGPSDLLKDFKNAKFGVNDAGPGATEQVPRKGVKIVRDSYDVPHIKATTYEGGIWAAGWVTAEDRALLLEQVRYASRVAAIDVPGVQALDVITSLRTFVPSAQTDTEIAKQTKVLQSYGKKGKRLLRDIDVFVSGINAYLKKSKSTAKPWTRNDMYALNALKGQFLGQGGGDEARRTQFLASLQTRLGGVKGKSVFDDLRQHDDPEQPATIEGSFPYAPLTKSVAGNVVIDPGSFVEKPGATLRGAPNNGFRANLASNVQLFAGKKSVTGRPLFVGGPQIGYYYPGFTLEMDMHAPGLVWRGATSVPFPGYLLIGRGPDFANMLTSAGGDIIDQYAETLCGGSDTKYLYKGKCTDMGQLDAGTLKGTGGSPDQRVVFNTTVHGPVVGYATAKGVKVAISSKRSSYGRDTVDQLFFQDLSNGTVHDPKSFFKAAAQTPQTFNAFYLDDKHIAAYTTGALPIRPGNVDPGLLTNGNGDYEWKGFLPADKHPHQADPKSGKLVNWNNNLAHGFGAADDEWMRAGASGRVDLLNKNLARLAKNGKQSFATIVSAMNAAATQDTRAIDTVPLLARLLAGTTAPSPRAQKMLDLMVAWNKAGGSRLDRDLDGKVDDPGAAVMDGSWNAVADAFMSPVLGTNLDEFARLQGRYDLPPGGQYGGWFQYFDKDVRTLLGDKVKSPFANRYCGGGDKGACQAAIWVALDDAGKNMAAVTGQDDPSVWRSDATAERIKFTPGLLPLTIRYTNRPSGIQTLASFDGHR